MLMQLRKRHSVLLYLVLYHQAWHHKKKTVHTSLAKIAEWPGMDHRTVKGCIRELEFKRFIARTSKGRQRSRMDLPGWKIPAADFDVRKQGWVPLPSDTWNRRYQVRALYYHRERKNSLPELYLAKEFSEFFEVKAEIGLEPVKKDS